MMILGILLHRWSWFLDCKSKTWHLRFGLIILCSGLFIAGTGLFQSYKVDWYGPWALTIGHQYTYVSSLFVALAYIFIYWSQTNILIGVQDDTEGRKNGIYQLYIEFYYLYTICYGQCFDCSQIR